MFLCPSFRHSWREMTKEDAQKKTKTISYPSIVKTEAMRAFEIELNM